MANIAPSDKDSLEKENRSLRQRVDELERTISDIEASRLETKPRVKAVWWKIALFDVLVVASLIPSYLVMRHRWQDARVNIEAINKIWWDTPLLKSLPYPQYFLIIFIATLFVGLVVLFWHGRPGLLFSNLTLGSLENGPDGASTKGSRVGHYILGASLVIVDLSAVWMVAQQRIPGWELVLALLLFIAGLILLEPQKLQIKELVKTQGRCILDTALFVIALCCALFAAFGESKSNLILYILFAMATINFLRHRKQVPLLFWVCIASLVALTWNIDGWHYVVIGDEYSFFTEVLNILDNRTAWQLLNLAFNGNLVYGTHPYFSSYIHDLFMKLFGNHNFGWRFSNPVLVACSLPLFYYFFKAFLSRRTAFLTVVLLGFSHYLLSFSKIGYNNLQSLFAMGLVLASFTWAIQSMKPIAFAMTGLSMGLCFYLFPAALYVIPLPILGLIFFLPPTRKEALIRWGWMILALALLAYPLMVQPRYWGAKIPGTFFYTDVSSSSGMLFENILRNILYSAYSHLYIPAESHYVAIGYLDLLSSAFVVIGFVVLIKNVLQKNRSALFLTTCFLFLFLIVGATHGRNFPTTTRMFLLLPWFALFTALGLEWIVDNATTIFQIKPNTTLYLLMASIVLLNLYQAYVVDVRNMTQYDTLAPMFIKTVREIDSNRQTPPKSYAFVTTQSWSMEGMFVIQEAYLVPASPRQIMKLPVEGNILPESDQELVSQRDIVVIVKGDLEEDVRTQVGIQLLSWGKSVCEIRNGKGILQFQLWHSGDLGWVCQ